MILIRLQTLSCITFFYFVFLLGNAVAQDISRGTWTLRLKGAVGSYPAGLTISERDGTEYVAGHYYCAPNFQDITLSGKMSINGIKLTSLNGAVLNLNYVNGETHPLERITNLLNSTGLSGTFKNGKVRFPTNFFFWDSYPGPLRASSYSMITTKSDEQFENMVKQFLIGVLTENKEMAADAIAFPVMVSDRPIPTKSVFFKRWDDIFNPRFLSVLQAAIPHEMPVVHGRALLGEMVIIHGHAVLSPGYVWFNQDGAVFLSPPSP